METICTRSFNSLYYLLSGIWQFDTNDVYSYTLFVFHTIRIGMNNIPTVINQNMSSEKKCTIIFFMATAFRMENVLIIAVMMA